MSTNKNDLSRLPYEEMLRQLKLIKNKQLYKEPTSTSPEAISNTLSIYPFKTLSSYNYLIKKNLIFIPETDEYIYISGRNIVIEKVSTKVQRLIPLTNKCCITSLTYLDTTSHMRLLFVGEKLFPDEKKVTSGAIELIRLEGNNFEKKLNLNIGAYINTSNYVYNTIAGKDNELCIIIVKSLDEKTNFNKLFFYNYITLSLVFIEDVKYDLIGVCINEKNENQILLYADNYCSLFKFNSTKIQLSLEFEFYNDEKGELLCAEFTQIKDEEAIVLSYKNEILEIYAKSTEEEFKNTQKKYKIFLKFDIFSLFSDKKLEEEYLTSNLDKEEDLEMLQNKENERVLSNCIFNNIIDFIPNFDLNNLHLDKNENYPNHIICRGNFILLFCRNTEFIIVLQSLEEKNETKIKISNIELLSHKINEFSDFYVDDKLTQMIIISGTEEKDLPQNAFEKKEESDTKKLIINYHKYKVNYINNIPNFKFEYNILENTSSPYSIELLAISQIPRMIIVNKGQDSQELFFYRQLTTSTLDDYLKDNNYEPSSQSIVQFKHYYFQEKTNLELTYHKKLDDKPLSICFSPNGKSFFIAYKDCGYLYIILTREIKEVFKITMYCRSCTYDDSGSYLAFATSEFDNEYNINVLNIATYEYEYIITKLPQPNKLSFADGSRNLIALFNDTSTNILGWSLNYDHRLIENSVNQKLKNEDKSDSIFLRISDFTGTIEDFAYDFSIDMCIITSHDKRQIVYCGLKDERHWEFPSDIEYPRLLLVKKYDSIIFGTQDGCIRTCAWPIQNIGKELMIDHPEYIETKLHNAKITSMCISNDLEYLYTSAEDGSVFISSIYGISNDIPLQLKNFYYFDPQNALPKKIYFSQNDVMYITESIYQEQIENLKKKKSSIQSLISEFQSKKEKITQNNMAEMENERGKLTQILDQKMKEVRDKEAEKEKESRKIKEESEIKYKILKDELAEMKKKFKALKEQRQNETTKLINGIKFAKEKYEQKKNELKILREKTNNNIVNNLENILTILQDQKKEIDRMVKERTKKFEAECEKNENLYENELRQKESKFKQFLAEFENQKKETDNEIMKKNKDNKNYDEKIGEWENHLKELKINNEELMETYIFNTLKLNQMNQLLSDNENKISIKEKIVKEKRSVNDRLEQLRFVLEYQIKNLILEKTPIEEQIKNFESLHSDFYKRFNLLYTELLNIGELIDNNQKCIDTYRDELFHTKNSLYRLKNLYKRIDISLNSILKNKIDSKKDLIDQIFVVYQMYLANFNENKKQTKFISNELKLQRQNIDKEIYNQKNNVLKELIDKRAERVRIVKEKKEMMKDIRLDNQLLIQECSNIRENLEDILKNINDIEKKFIELTNNNTFMNDKNNAEHIKDIQGRIREAKHKILSDVDDKFNGEKLPPIKLKKITNDSEPIDILNAEELLKKQQKNTEELIKQQKEIEDIEKNYKEFIKKEENTG